MESPTHLSESYIDKVFFSFSCLVKFPTLNYLGNAENPYPHIHVDVIQDLAMSHCGVPHAEVDQTLLLAKELTDGGGAEQQHFSHGAHW
jgi:hypothetical protein